MVHQIIYRKQETHRMIGDSSNEGKNLSKRCVYLTDVTSTSKFLPVHGEYKSKCNDVSVMLPMTYILPSFRRHGNVADDTPDSVDASTCPSRSCHRTCTGRRRSARCCVGRNLQIVYKDDNGAEERTEGMEIWCDSHSPITRELYEQNNCVYLQIQNWPNMFYMHWSGHIQT